MLFDKIAVIWSPPDVYPTYNSGSLLLSDFQSLNYTDGSESYYFTFSTIETPFDGEHPVAGNRRFGIFNTPEQPNQWTFYTMGVDRAWDFWDDLANRRFEGFEQADALWQNMQENVLQKINTQGGNGTYYAKSKYIARPKYENVSRYLMKQITFQQLKDELCP